MKKDLIKLILSLFLCQLAGFIGSLVTTPSIPIWYASLEKPSFSPPNWVFSPVWITLYALMGISLYLLWREDRREPKVKIALFFFIIQLILNISWSMVFFGLRLPFLAFLEILLLWAVILLTILTSLKVSKVAGYLLVPYLLWVTFAAVLNYFLWFLNR